MNFTCDNCQRRYSIADEKVRGKTVKIRCRNCDTLVTVVGPSGDSEERALPVRPNPATGVGAVALAAEAPSQPSGKTPWDDEATVAAPPLSGKAEWFAMVKGKQVGPFDPRGVAELVRVGDVSLKSYLWRKGMPEWKRGADVPELAPVFAGGPLASSAVAPRPAPVAPVPAPAPTRAPVPAPVAAPIPAPAPKAAPSQPAPRPAPAPAPAPIASLDDLPFDPPAAQPPTASQVGKVMNLGELFSDADLPKDDAAAGPDLADEPTQAPSAQKKTPVGKAKSKAKAPEEDPFAALGGGSDDGQLPPPGEATRFFIAQAGVNKRNPWWKTALFIVGGFGIVAGVLLALASMNVMPLKVKTVDASGQVVEQSVFSGEGVSALGDMLLGRNKKAPVVEEKTPVHKTGGGTAVASKDPQSGANAPKIDITPQTHVPTADELAALYGDASKKPDTGPKIRKDLDAAKVKDTNSGALSPEQITKTVQQSQSAFQSCIEQELRKNPNMRVPKFYIVATVAPSGVVKAASIDRKEVDGTGLGECLKGRARRMVFAQFEGEDVDVEIPLIVGTAM